MQGVSGIGLIALSPSAIADALLACGRSKDVELMGAVLTAAPVPGLVSDGWFTEGPGLQWAFWVNLAALLFRIAMVGALGYLSMYSQRSIGAKVVEAGLLMIPHDSVLSDAAIVFEQLSRGTAQTVSSMKCWYASGLRRLTGCCRMSTNWTRSSQGSPMRIRPT